MKLNDRGYIEAAMALVCVTAVFVAVTIYFFVPMLIGNRGPSDRAEVKREEAKVETRRIESQEKMTAALLQQNAKFMEQATRTIIQQPAQDNTSEVVKALIPLLQARSSSSNSMGWVLLAVAIIVSSAAVAIVWIKHGRRDLRNSDFRHYQVPVEHNVKLSFDRGEDLNNRALVARNEDRQWKL